MHARRAACTALLALAALTAGCSSRSADDKAHEMPSPTAAKNSASAKAAADTGPLHFGQATRWSATNPDGSHISGTSTVLSYTQPAKDVSLPKSLQTFSKAVWAVLEVKVCADPGSATVEVAQSPWKLGFADDTRLDSPGISGPGVAEPEYAASGATVKGGTCLRGKITYSVRQGTRPNQIVYALQGADPVEWAVPKD